MNLPHSPRGGRLMIGFLVLTGMIPMTSAEATSFRDPSNAEQSQIRAHEAFYAGPRRAPTDGITRSLDTSNDGQKRLKEKYRMC